MSVTIEGVGTQPKEGLVDSRFVTHTSKMYTSLLYFYPFYYLDALAYPRPI